MVSHFTQRYRTSSVGITLVYALSGFFLSHRNIFPAAKKETFTINLPPNLNSESLLKYWELNLPLKLNNHKESENTIQLFLERGKGYYNKSNGETSYEIITRRPVISFLNQLHRYRKKGWPYIVDAYAFLLGFLAISGLFIQMGKTGSCKEEYGWCL
ncbi:MAG: peptidase [Bacteroidales bacterium]|nr:peptidase [Bacteroidales bacterium]